jgi:hypothetical protein
LTIPNQIEAGTINNLTTDKGMSDPVESADQRLRGMPLRDLLIDFLGSLVPGIVYTGWAVIVGGIPIFMVAFVVISACCGKHVPTALPSINTVISTTKDFIESFRLELMAFFLVISYIIGCFFFRQDPKTPDKKSFNQMLKTFRDGPKQPACLLGLISKWLSICWAPARWVSRRVFGCNPFPSKGDLLANWVVKNVEDCEFPYPDLKAFLESRRLTHLATLVTWNGADDPRRTKNIINILKVRIAHHGMRASDIHRNEAHIRLMSSTWYMSRALRSTAIAGGMASIVGIIVARHISTTVSSDLMFAQAMLGVACLLTMFAAWRFQVIIQRFLHYQRVREIVFVLETAYTAFRDKPQLISDICPDYK